MSRTLEGLGIRLENSKLSDHKETLEKEERNLELSDFIDELGKDKNIESLRGNKEILGVKENKIRLGEGKEKLKNTDLNEPEYLSRRTEELQGDKKEQKILSQEKERLIDRREDSELEKGNEQIPGGPIVGVMNLPKDKERIGISVPEESLTNHLEKIGVEEKSPILEDHIEKVKDQREEIEVLNKYREDLRHKDNPTLEEYQEKIKTSNEDPELETKREDLSDSRKTELSDKVERIKDENEIGLENNIETLSTKKPIDELPEHVEHIYGKFEEPEELRHLLDKKEDLKGVKETEELGTAAKTIPGDIDEIKSLNKEKEILVDKREQIELEETNNKLPGELKKENLSGHLETIKVENEDPALGKKKEGLNVGEGVGSLEDNVETIRVGEGIDELNKRKEALGGQLVEPALNETVEHLRTETSSLDELGKHVESLDAASSTVISNLPEDKEMIQGTSDNTSLTDIKETVPGEVASPTLSEHVEGLGGTPDDKLTLSDHRENIDTSAAKVDALGDKREQIIGEPLETETLVDYKENITDTRDIELEDTRLDISDERDTNLEDTKVTISDQREPELEDYKDNLEDSREPALEDYRESLSDSRDTSLEDTKITIEDSRENSLVDYKENITDTRDIELEDTRLDISDERDLSLYDETTSRNLDGNTIPDSTDEELYDETTKIAPSGNDLEEFLHTENTSKNLEGNTIPDTLDEELYTSETSKELEGNMIPDTLDETLEDYIDSLDDYHDNPELHTKDTSRELEMNKISDTLDEVLYTKDETVGTKNLGYQLDTNSDSGNNAISAYNVGDSGGDSDLTGLSTRQDNVTWKGNTVERVGDDTGKQNADAFGSRTGEWSEDVGLYDTILSPENIDPDSYNQGGDKELHTKADTIQNKEIGYILDQNVTSINSQVDDYEVNEEGDTKITKISTTQNDVVWKKNNTVIGISDDSSKVGTDGKVHTKWSELDGKLYDDSTKISEVNQNKRSQAFNNLSTDLDEESEEEQTPPDTSALLIAEATKQGDVDWTSNKSVVINSDDSSKTNQDSSRPHVVWDGENLHGKDTLTSQIEQNKDKNGQASTNAEIHSYSVEYYNQHKNDELEEGQEALQDPTSALNQASGKQKILENKNKVKNISDDTSKVNQTGETHTKWNEENLEDYMEDLLSDDETKSQVGRGKDLKFSTKDDENLGTHKRFDPDSDKLRDTESRIFETNKNSDSISTFSDPDKNNNGIIDFREGLEASARLKSNASRQKKNNIWGKTNSEVDQAKSYVVLLDNDENKQNADNERQHEVWTEDAGLYDAALKVTPDDENKTQVGRGKDLKFGTKDDQDLGKHKKWDGKELRKGSVEILDDDNSNSINSKITDVEKSEDDAENSSRLKSLATGKSSRNIWNNTNNEIDSDKGLVKVLDDDESKVGTYRSGNGKDGIVQTEDDEYRTETHKRFDPDSDGDKIKKPGNVDLLDDSNDSKPINPDEINDSDSFETEVKDIINSRDDLNLYYTNILKFAQNKNLDKGWGKKVSGLMSAYLSGKEISQERAQQFEEALYRTIIQDEQVKIKRDSFLEDGKGERYNKNETSALGDYTEEMKSYELPGFNLMGNGCDPSSYLRWVAEKTVGKTHGKLRAILLDETLGLLVLARDTAEKLIHANRDRLPGNDVLSQLTSGGLSLGGIAKSAVKAGAKALFGGSGPDMSLPNNRPDKNKERTKWDELLSDKTIDKEESNNRLTEFNFADRYITADGKFKGMATTLQELCGTTNVSSVEDMYAALRASPYITTANKVTSGEYNRLIVQTLDTNQFWEIVFTPFVGTENGWVSYLPPITEINTWNKTYHGVETMYSTWIPITGFELSKAKLTSKTLPLFDGEISYPISMEFTNEFRLTIADDQFKSWRTYFERCMDVAIYNSELHRAKDYDDNYKFHWADVDLSDYELEDTTLSIGGMNISVPDVDKNFKKKMDKWNSFKSGSSAGKFTAIDKKYQCVAPYKNITFRCTIYSMTPQFSTVSKYDLLLVMKDFVEERSGEIDGEPGDLTVMFSIVGENPTDERPSLSVDKNNFKTKKTKDTKRSNTASIISNGVNSVIGVL